MTTPRELVVKYANQDLPYEQFLQNNKENQPCQGNGQENESRKGVGKVVKRRRESIPKQLGYLSHQSSDYSTLSSSIQEKPVTQMKIPSSYAASRLQKLQASTPTFDGKEPPKRADEQKSHYLQRHKGPGILKQPRFD